MRALVWGASGRVVGIGGFHGPPGGDWLRDYAPDGVEFGYTVFEEFRRQGIAYESCSLDKSSLYMEAAPRFATGEVEIPEDATLLRELRLLERRRGSAGRDRVDHPGREHDDLANSVAGALWLAARGTGSYEITLGPMREMAQEFREMGGVFSSTPGERIASRFDW